MNEWNYWITTLQAVPGVSLLYETSSHRLKGVRLVWGEKCSLLLLLLLSCFSRVWLCATNPIDGSPPGSPIPGILQARTLEWVAISFSNAWKWKVKVKSLSRVRLLATPWTAAHQAPPSMGFSTQEYWSGVPLPFPEVLSRGIKTESLLSFQGSIHSFP